MKKISVILLAVFLAFSMSFAVCADAVSNYNAYKQSAGYFSPESDIVIKGTEYTDALEAEVGVDDDSFENEVLSWTNEKGSVTYTFNSPATARYYFRLFYGTLKGSGSDIRIGVKIDGEYPFTEAQELSFKRCFCNVGDVRSDRSGNQFAPVQGERFGLYDDYAMDPLGRESEPFEFLISEGEHILELVSIDEPFAIEKIVFEIPKSPISYAEYISGHADKKSFSGKEIIVQGENAEYKSASYLVPLADMSDVSMISYDGGKNDGITEKINYIGSTNWQSQGDKISWKVQIEEAGLYKLSVKHRQKYVTNGVSYRKLTVDGEIPFIEAASIAFPYNSGWDYLTFSNASSEPYLIYLSAGEHLLSLTVTLGEFSGVYRDLSSVVDSMGNLYRKIVMITGETIDANRSYELFKQIPGFNDSLAAMRDELNRIAANIEAIQGKRGGNGVSTINSAVLIINQMIENYYTAHRYKGQFYTQYCSLSSYITELCELPLDIDYFALSSTDYDIESEKPGFFERLLYGIKRFLYSFVSDYNTVGGNEKNVITIWVNWGRDQTKILNNLISSSFTPETGVSVNLKITNATMIQGILSGNGPDLCLHMQRTAPVNYAMRGALYDLTRFDDYDEVVTRFNPTATVPYEYKGGVYALPDTQSFYLMFARDDVLSELGVEVPETWDEFIKVMAIIQQNNMQVGLPIMQLTNITQVNMGLGSLSLFPTILLQKGGQVYNEQRTATALDSVVSLQAFEFWTDLFTKYKAPVSFDFYSRFRTGTLPLAIQSYAQYITLNVAAPEISGKWSVHEIPGFIGEDGSINNVQTGGGTGAAILNKTKNPEGAWAFLKWWTSADTQAAYSQNVENVLGVAGRVTSANVEAVKRLSWQNDVLDTLISSWEKVEELPELPGGYYVPRSIDMAFWNTYNKAESPKDLLLEWNEIANSEIERKIKQYEGR
ncbi:MAG: extracellular solute-binding protein [Clostridia bacterium]|nr:extracellular solute-binding protein [Clostridia bacterium]